MEITIENLSDLDKYEVKETSQHWIAFSPSPESLGDAHG